MNPTILLIEDNPDIMNINRTVLRELDFQVLEATTLGQARAILSQTQPSLIVLDIMLPDGDGLHFCQQLRTECSTPILFLTALGKNSDIVSGLMCGGDDYLTKPYDLDVFCARIHSLLRRAAPPPTSDTITFGALTLKCDSGRAYLDGRDLLLTSKEYAILKYLTQSGDRYVRAEELYRKLWDADDAGDVSLVWTHISRIRKHFGAAPVDITSKRGLGYRLTRKDV